MAREAKVEDVTLDQLRRGFPLNPGETLVGFEPSHNGWYRIFIEADVEEVPLADR